MQQLSAVSASQHVFMLVTCSMPAIDGPEPLYLRTVPTQPSQHTRPSQHPATNTTNSPTTLTNLTKPTNRPNHQLQSHCDRYEELDVPPELNTHAFPGVVLGGGSSPLRTFNREIAMEYLIMRNLDAALQDLPKPANFGPTAGECIRLKSASGCRVALCGCCSCGHVT